MIDWAYLRMDKKWTQKRITEWKTVVVRRTGRSMSRSEGDLQRMWGK